MSFGLTPAAAELSIAALSAGTSPLSKLLEVQFAHLLALLACADLIQGWLIG
jgi:hypothetical protein